MRHCQETGGRPEVSRHFSDSSFSCLSAPIYRSEEDYFPFSETSSGNLKVHPRQVVFSTKKLSVLVADPDRTRISVDRGSTMASRQHHESGDILKSGAMQTIMSQVSRFAFRDS